MPLPKIPDRNKIPQRVNNKKFQAGRYEEQKFLPSPLNYNQNSETKNYNLEAFGWQTTFPCNFMISKKCLCFLAKQRKKKAT